jgi:hypothetical protein
MSCPRVEACGLPAVIKSEVAHLLWHRKFCVDEASFRECHRFKIAETGRPIPVGMLPNGYVLGVASR